MKAFSDACAQGHGKPRRAESLEDQDRRPGCSLAEACAKGALANLTDLILHENRIGDPGLLLADACAKGALPSLELLCVDKGPLGVHHPKLMEVRWARGIRLV